MTPVTFYQPVGGGVFRALDPIDAKVVQRGRGDFEQSGFTTPVGQLSITTYSDIGLKPDWYAVVLGQQFRIEGISPIPPFGIMVEVECKRNNDKIKVEEIVSVGGEPVSVGEDELAVTGKRESIGE